MNELERFQKQLDELVEARNRKPNPEMDNLSPIEMHQILYRTFESSSLIQIRYDAVAEEELVEAIPFLKLMLYYLNVILEKKEIKLTARGNLPRKLVFELYDLGLIPQHDIETGITKLSKEEDSIAIQNIKIIAQLSGLTKIRTGKLSLTAKGKKLLPTPRAVLAEIFPIYAKKFNWGYHDGFGEEGGVQATVGYLLYLLIQYGKEERLAQFYSQKHAQAFPTIFEEAARSATFGTPEGYYLRMLSLRLFELFLVWFGFVQIRHEGGILIDKKDHVQSTEVFRKIFSCTDSSGK